MLRHQQEQPTNQQTQPMPAWQTLYHHCQSANPTVASRAYRQLRELLLPRARSCLYTKPGLQAEVDDCVQEALTDIWASMTAHRGPSGEAKSFQSWCQTIVSRKVLDLLRRPAHRLPETCFWEIAEDQEIADALDVEEMVVDRLSITTLFQDVLNHLALTPMQRQVLWLHCVEELDYAEIAKRLHKNVTTIRVNRHRAIVVLQKDTALMARIGALLDTHHPFHRQNRGRQGIDW